MASTHRIPEIAATYFAGLVAGGTLFVAVVQAPAWSKLSPSEQLTHWRTYFTPSKNVFKPASLTLVPTLCSLGYVTSNSAYYAAAVPFGLMAPFTGLALAGINEKLLTMKDPEDDAAKEQVTTLVAKWAKRHAVRCVFTSVGFAFCLYGLSQPSKS